MLMTAAPAGSQDRSYPRPQLRRAHWLSLDGTWDFSLDLDASVNRPSEVRWQRTIQVPFAPETERSGIGHKGFLRACWYRRNITTPMLGNGDRLRLHFGAVDHIATVWVNGTLAGRHEGGYTPFTLDITELLHNQGPQVLVVCAEDDPADLQKPRGKQDWQAEPHSIWYYRTTGIWQSVWLERVNAIWIDDVVWTPNLERWEIGFEAWVAGARRDGLRLTVKLYARGQLIADDTYCVISGEVHRRIAFSDPGIDDFRNDLLWSPASPTLIEAHLQLWAGRGELMDEVFSYTALRSVCVQGDRFLLNGRPFYLRLVLDQGYWPESGLTAPDDHALRRDVELVKAMGFNGVRKHQKIEDPRYLYWADVLGLLVWEEMPSAYRFTKKSIERVTHEWMQAVRRDSSHPCIIAWVPFNESWGVPNLPSSAVERHYVQALYHLTRTLDPTRPVVGNDGWESVATDIVGIHDYDADLQRIARRYGAGEELPTIFRRERPGGRVLILENHTHAGSQPIVLSEFGGIAFSPDTESTWGYSRSESVAAFASAYTELLATVCSIGMFCGFCYTQFADTYQEANGLLYADRTPKFPIEEIAAATLGHARRGATR